MASKITIIACRKRGRLGLGPVVKTEQYSRGEENVQKTINSVSFIEQENQVNQDHHEDIEKMSLEQ